MSSKLYKLANDIMISWDAHGVEKFTLRVEDGLFRFLREHDFLRYEHKKYNTKLLFYFAVMGNICVTTESRDKVICYLLPESDQRPLSVFT